LQNQVATGQRIFLPEDDPSGIGRALGHESERRQLAQFAANARRALEVSQASHSGLQAVAKVSSRANEIALLGGGVLGAGAAQAYAAEVDQLIEQTVQFGNTRHGNEHLFGGTASDAPPFLATRDTAGRVTAVAYAGTTERAPIDLSAGSAVTPGTGGDTNLGLRDLLNHLVALRDALAAGDTAAVSVAGAGLGATEDILISALAENGGVQARIEASLSQQQDLATSVESLLAQEVDANLPATIVKLTQTQTAYQAALQSAANILKTSLLDFIR